MAKTNYTKVEQALEEGLRKIQIDRLFELADIAASIGSGSSSAKKMEAAKKERMLLRRIELDLMRLRKKDCKIYAKLKIKKSEFEEMAAHPEKLTSDDWKKLRSLRKKTKEMIETLFGKKSDSALIEKEQERHINKRFNVNEKWLPL